MKKWFLIALPILLLVFLIIRSVNTYFQDIEVEKKWYVGQLHLNFSGEIDSVTILKKDIGLILFHVTRGDAAQLESSHENTLNNRVEHSGFLKLLVFKKNGKIEIIAPNPTRYLSGDSICINTDQNQIIVYRNGAEISRDEVVSSLRARPWFRVTNESSD